MTSAIVAVEKGVIVRLDARGCEIIQVDGGALQPAIEALSNHDAAATLAALVAR
jgi:hypothetical protein